MGNHQFFVGRNHHGFDFAVGGGNHACVAEAGGFVGDLINKGMLQMVDTGVAALIYVLLIIITLLFITRTSPFTLISRIWNWIRRDTSEDDTNMAVMKKAAELVGGFGGGHSVAAGATIPPEKKEEFLEIVEDLVSCQVI